MGQDDWKFVVRHFPFSLPDYVASKTRPPARSFNLPPGSRQSVPSGCQIAGRPKAALLFSFLLLLQIDEAHAESHSRTVMSNLAFEI